MPATIVINRIWLVLLAATLITFWLGESGLAGHARMAPVLLMFGLAFVKGLFVILHFMELRQGPLLWRGLMVGWLTLVISVIVLTYAVALALSHAA